jgi:hypothetical protein
MAGVENGDDGTKPYDGAIDVAAGDVAAGDVAAGDVAAGDGATSGTGAVDAVGGAAVHVCAAGGTSIANPAIKRSRNPTAIDLATGAVIMLLLYPGFIRLSYLFRAVHT